MEDKYFDEGALVNMSHRYTILNNTGGALVRGELVDLAQDAGTPKMIEAVAPVGGVEARVVDPADDQTKVTVVSSVLIATTPSGDQVTV